MQQMYIEDPFEHTHNLARVLDRSGAIAIIEEFKRAVEALKKRDLMTMLEVYNKS